MRKNKTRILAGIMTGILLLQNTVLQFPSYADEVELADEVVELDEDFPDADIWEDEEITFDQDDEESFDKDFVIEDDLSVEDETAEDGDTAELVSDEAGSDGMYFVSEETFDEEAEFQTEDVYEKEAVTEAEEASETVEAMGSALNQVRNPRTEAYTNNYNQSDLRTTWDCVWFGNYPQNDSTGATKEPIKWRVLSVSGNYAFVLADECLDWEPYNTERTNVTWKSCTLRAWLNSTFLNTAFSSGEQGAIQTKTVENADNADYGTSGGNSTSDKVYLLSYDEATNSSYGFPEDYDVISKTRQSKYTAYAQAQGAIGFGGLGYWWLRSPGDTAYYAMCVIYYGLTDKSGIYVDRSSCAIRPALNIDLSSPYVSYAGTVSSDGEVEAVNKITLEADPEYVHIGEPVSLRASIDTEEEMDKVSGWQWSVKGPEGKEEAVLSGGMLTYDIAHDYVFIKGFTATEPGIYTVELTDGEENGASAFEMIYVLLDKPEEVKGKSNDEGKVTMQWIPVEKADGYCFHFTRMEDGREEKKYISVDDVSVKAGKASCSFFTDMVFSSGDTVIVSAYVDQGEARLEGEASLPAELSEGVDYTLEGDTLTLHLWDAAEPEWLSTDEAPWYDKADDICHVYVDRHGVEKIGDFAFSGYQNLRTVTFKENIPGIGSKAFTGDNVTAYCLSENISEDLLPEPGNGISGWITSSFDGKILKIGGKGKMQDLHESCIGDTPWYHDLENVFEIYVEGEVSYIGNTSFRNTDDSGSLLRYVVLYIGKNVREIGSNILPVTEASSQEDRVRSNVCFEGPVPIFSDNAFNGSELIAYCPVNDASWTQEVMKDYGGSVTWGKIRWDFEEYLSEDSTKCRLTITGDGPMPDYLNSQEVPWGAGSDRTDVVTSIRMENGVTCIGTNAFREMPNVEKIRIAGTVCEIHAKAFEKTGHEANLKGGPQIEFEGNAPIIDKDAFGTFPGFENGDISITLYPFDIYYPSGASGWENTMNAAYSNRYLAWVEGNAPDLLSPSQMWAFGTGAEMVKELNTDYSGEEEFKKWGYYLSSEDEKRLLSGLSRVEKNRIKYTTGVPFKGKKYYNLNGTDEEGSYVEYDGNCRGVSISEAAIYSGYINPSFISSPLGSFEKDHPSERTISFINYYHLQQHIKPLYEMQAVFQNLPQPEQLQHLENQVLQAQSQHQMVEISFRSWMDMVDDPYYVAHTIMGYHVETGRFNVYLDGQSYTFDHRILTYDPSEYGSPPYETCWFYDIGDTGFNYHTHAFYYSTSADLSTCGMWMIPYKYMNYPCSTDETINTKDPYNNAKLEMVNSGYAYINAIDYETGRNNYKTEEYMNTFVTYEQDFEVSLSDGRHYQVQGGVLGASSTQDGAAVISVLTGNNSQDQVILCIPGNASQYSITTAGEAAFSLFNKGETRYAYQENAGTIIFGMEGLVKLEMEKPGKAEISFVIDDLTNDEGERIIPVNSMDFSIDDAQSFSLQRTREGMELHTDSEAYMQVAKYEEDTEEKSVVSCMPNEGGVLVASSSDDPESITVKADTDHTGHYDTVILAPEMLGAGKIYGLSWELDKEGTLHIYGKGPLTAFAPDDSFGDAKLPRPWENYKDMITRLVVEEGVTRIGSLAFDRCSNLQYVQLPNSLGFIEVEAFNECTSLKEIDIPDKIKEIPMWAFWGCTALERVSLPSELETIGEGAFAYCTGLSETTVPSTLKEIGVNAFMGCPNLCLMCNVHHFDMIDYAKENHISYDLTGEHEWGSWKKIKAAGCIQDGKKSRSCTVCDAVEESVISHTGHKEGNWKIQKAPTVSEAGIRVKYCTKCGQKIQSQRMEPLKPSITLSSYSVVIANKESQVIRVSGLQTGDKVLSWNSNNNSVASVKLTNHSDGLITASGAGDAIVKVTLKSGLAKTVRVRVPEVKTKKIGGLKKSYTIKKGKKRKLAPVLFPSNSTQKITFKSSNKKVVKVNASGVIRGIKKGKAIITVKSGKKKVKIRIKVK